MSVDVLLVSLGTTRGWRVADALFLEQVRAAGAAAEAVSVRMGAAGRLRRGYPVNDLVEMTAARRAIAAAVRTHAPRAVVLSTTTAAMAAPALTQPYAVRLDAPARLNRPGPRNALLHSLERRALARATLVLPWSRAARDELPPGSAPAVILPPPVEPSAAAATGGRPRVAVAYVPDPKAKGLDVLIEGWRAATPAGARLAVYGIDPAWAMRFLSDRGIEVPSTVDWLGMTPIAPFRQALREAHVYVGSARWEDFGQAPLEALADGALLATVPSGGPFEALAFARELAPDLVSEDLGTAIAAAFAFDAAARPAYTRRAEELLAPYRPDAIQATVTERVLPALGIDPTASGEVG